MRSVILLLACLGCAASAPQHRGHDWNEVYRKGTGFTKAPNALLASTVEGQKPGRALDVGMGQGRNALFLARQGWTVTGFDPSEEGVRQAREVAAAEGLALDARVSDSEHFDFGLARYELVALIYVGGADIAPKVAAALKPGGLVVVEFFQFNRSARFNVPGSFTEGELEALFPGFEVLRSEWIDDRADWSLRQDKLVRFVARKR